MATPAQIAANRANAQLSTGPRTDAGKEKTRQNALRHGLCAGIPQMSDEAEEEVQELLDGLREEHQPVGPTEEILVYKIAEAFFYAKRAAYLLSEKLDWADRGDDTPRDVGLMLRYHAASDRAWYRALNELRKVQKERRLQEIGSVSQTPEATSKLTRKSPNPHPPRPPRLAPFRKKPNLRRPRPPWRPKPSRPTDPKAARPPRELTKNESTRQPKPAPRPPDIEHRAFHPLDRAVPLRNNRLTCFFCFSVWSLPCPAQTSPVAGNPMAGNQAAIDVGKANFRLYCSPCHGINAKGGRGPDLTRGAFAAGETDADLFRVISVGVEGTDMTAYNARFDKDMIWRLIAYIRSVAQVQPSNIPGNMQHGREIFLGKGGCGACHAIAGKGGDRAGADSRRTRAISRLSARKTTHSQFVDNTGLHHHRRDPPRWSNHSWRQQRVRRLFGPTVGRQ